MSWQKERDRWLNGNIPPEVSLDDVEKWLRSDEIWQRADAIKFKADADKDGKKKGTGSHFCIIHIKGMRQVKKRWNGDILDISSISGRKIQRWQVQELVDAYNELKGLTEDPPA